MSLTRREEHLHFSSPVSPNSHADSRDSECVRLCANLPVCVCVNMHRATAHSTYLLTSMFVFAQLHVPVWAFITSCTKGRPHVCMYLYFDTCFVSSRRDALQPNIFTLLDMELTADRNRGGDLVKRVYSSGEPQGREEHMENLKISKVWHIFAPCAI